MAFKFGQPRNPHQDAMKSPEGQGQKAFTAKNGRLEVIYRTFSVFKERVQTGITNFGLIFRNQPPVAPGDFKLTA